MLDTVFQRMATKLYVPWVLDNCENDNYEPIKSWYTENRSEKTDITFAKSFKSIWENSSWKSQGMVHVTNNGKMTDSFHYFTEHMK
jgi:hypothetical protein